MTCAVASLWGEYSCNTPDVTNVPKAVVPGRISSSGLSVKQIVSRSIVSRSGLSAEVSCQQKRVVGRSGLSEFCI